MKEFCENTYCETRAVKEVSVSVRKPSDQVRSLCATCEEVFTWGVQHGRFVYQHNQLWLLAIADKGIVVYAHAYPNEKAAIEGLIEYLREYHQYQGAGDYQAIRLWLKQHDENLSVEIISQDGIGKRENQAESSLNQVNRHLEEHGFVVLGINQQDAHADCPYEAWAYNGPLDFQEAKPVTFGLGKNSHEALDALNTQLRKGTGHD